MNLSCVICADLLNASDEVYTTNCGHIFHYDCLYQWLERSESCPQCRNKCSERNIHKIYFNIQSLNTSTIDITSLHQELDNIKLRCSGQDKELKHASDEIDTLKADRKKCMKTISGLERELAEKKFLIFSYDEQLKHLKADNKMIENLRNEVKNLKSKNQMMTMVQDVLSSTSVDVENLLKNENNCQALCIMVAALRRELRISEKRRSELRESLKLVQCDFRKEQKHKESLLERISHLESRNYQLTEEFKNIKGSNKNVNEINETIMQTGNQDLLRNYASTPQMQSERIRIIQDANSPYFSIKSSSIGLASLLKNSDNIRSMQQYNINDKLEGCLRKTTSDLSERFSIFKRPRLEVPTKQVRINQAKNLSFDGTGGSGKSEDNSNFSIGNLASDIKAKSVTQRLKSGQLKKL